MAYDFIAVQLVYLEPPKPHTLKDKKLQVFVSSTYIDLIEERQAAVESILKAGHIPAGMELFTTGSESQWKVIKRWIDESDVYMLILGARYGSIDPDTGKSYTQMEFEYAIEINKPLFSIVLSEKFIDAKVEKSGKSVLEKDNGIKLSEFSNLVKSNLVEFCNDAKDIKLIVSNALAEMSYDKSLVGWIRGDQGVNNAVLAEEMARLSQENAKLRTQLQSNQTSEPLYNTLTFDALKTMLVAETAVGKGFNNLFEFFLWLGPKSRVFNSISSECFLIRGDLRKFCEMLETYDILEIFKESSTLYIKATKDGHNFYLKAKSLTTNLSQ